MFSAKIQKIYREEVVAVPQLIESTDFGFSDPSVNAQKYTELADRRDGKKLRKFGPYELIQFPGNIIAGLDRKGGRIVYYMHFKTVSMLGRTFVTQTTLWSHPVMQDEASKAGFFTKKSVSTYVFFDVLLSMHDGLLTDTQQTMAGKRFWFKRITVALDRGLHVSLVDKVATSSKKVVTPIKTTEDLMKQEQHIWSADGGSRGKLLAITKKAL